MERNIDKLARELANGLSLDELRRKQGANPYEKKIDIAPAPKSDAELRYWQSVFSAEPRAPMFHARKIAQEMSYDDARKKTWAILMERAAEISALKNTDFAFVFIDKQAAVVAAIIRYFINDPTCPLNLAKGLFVCGLPGAGKTEVMMAMHRLCKENGLSKYFEITDMSTVHILAKGNKDFDPVTPLKQFARCLDEFGRHIGPTVRFGDALDINEAVIEERYKGFSRHGKLTHIVTNMTPNEAAASFSPMITDRIKEMCQSVEYPGTSNRK